VALSGSEWLCVRLSASLIR